MKEVNGEATELPTFFVILLAGGWVTETRSVCRKTGLALVCKHLSIVACAKTYLLLRNLT